MATVLYARLSLVWIRTLLFLCFAFMLLFSLALNLRTASADDSYISADITFTNTGLLPLYRGSGNLDHGCWGTEPPLVIDPLSTVTWQSHSCGVATGTEGWVDYRPYGTPDGILGHFYWNIPFVGDNSGSDSGPTGCVTSHSGPPESGTNVTVFFTMGCSSSTPDGIADVWKLHGAEFDAGGSAGVQFIDLPAMGAVVGQKDIFLHVDWMEDATHDQQLSANTFKNLTDIFAANGYALHIDAGPNSILNYVTNATWGSLSRAASIPYQASLGTTTVDPSGNISAYDWSAFTTIKESNFLPTGRAPFFHYVVVASKLGSVTNSGIARNPGTDIIITLGAFTGGVGSDNEQLGTLMHELGHNLGLGHGGGDNIGYKPNYFSVMNYNFQMTGVTKNGVATFDYSHLADSQLDENNLYETSGVGSAGGFSTIRYCPATAKLAAARLFVPNATGPIDWDCDGKINTDDLVAADINGDPREPANTLGLLTSYSDWINIRLVAGSIGAFGAALPPEPMTTTLDDPTPTMVQDIQPQDTTPPETTATADSLPNSFDWYRVTVSVTLSATDDISGAVLTEYNLDGAGWTTYSAPISISTDANHTLQFRSTDRALNVETAQSMTIKLDTTSPVVTYSGNAGTYRILDTLNITCTATDNLSGVRTNSCANITGPAYAFVPGINSFSASAEDYAGNASSQSIGFTLKVTTTDLCTLSKRFASNARTGNDLCVPLQIVDLADTTRNPSLHQRSIETYRLLIRTQRGTGLTAQEADTLIRMTQGL